MSDLLKSVKGFLNVSSNFKDAEIKTLIATCKYDLGRVGIKSEKIKDSDDTIIFLIELYCKSHFCDKTEESLRWQKTYEDLRLAVSLDKDYRENHD